MSDLSSREDLRTASTRHVDEVRNIGRDLTEKALRMRAASYLSDVKARLLTQTIFSMKDSKLHLLNEMARRSRLEGQLRTAKQVAEEATNTKNKFVSLVVHDLRSSLGAISGLVKLVLAKDSESLGPIGRESLVQAAESTDELLGMVETLLDITRLQSGVMPVDPARVPVRDLVGGVAERLAHLACQKGIEIHNRVPDQLMLYADRLLLREVVQNLLSNAIKFTDPGGRIELFQPQGLGGVLCVRDNGVGIEPERLRRLYSFAPIA
jgi:signal transduction histidine kinase